MTTTFDYDIAFERNLGWLTRPEQQALRRKLVAIAGLGGVGGLHLLTLARQGIGRFHIAEFDTCVSQSIAACGVPLSPATAQQYIVGLN